MSHKPSRLLLLLTAMLVAQATIALSQLDAKTITVGPDGEWFRWLTGDQLQPGDQLVLQAGTYRDPRRLVIRHRGTEDQSIMIRAAEGARVIFHRPDARQNSFDVEGAQYLQLIGLEITGGAAGIRIRPAAEQQPIGIVLQQLHIHHIDGVAITCNHPGGVYRNMVFRGNHIHNTGGHGEAFYLGGNDASAILADSIIQNNYLHDLNGPGVSQGDGVELKLGSYGNHVVGNVIHDTGYPGIIAYGTRGKPQNIIEGNIIWRAGDHAIQVAADAIVRDNWIADAAGCGIYSREHQGAIPSNLQIVDNRIIAKRNPALRIVGKQSSGAREVSTIEISRNRFYAADGTIAIRIEKATLHCQQPNKGQGQIEGPESLNRCWQEATPDANKLPELPDNPAWQYLDRSKLQKAFTP